MTTLFVSFAVHAIEPLNKCNLCAPIHLLQVAGAPLSGVTEGAIRTFYDEHPNLFENRKIYVIQLVTVDSTLEQRDDIVGHAERSNSLTEYTDWMTSEGLFFDIERKEIGAEGVPLTILDRLAVLNPGQSVAIPEDNSGTTIYTLVSSRSAPVSYEKAHAAIEYFLTPDAAKRPIKSVQPV